MLLYARIAAQKVIVAGLCLEASGLLLFARHPWQGTQGCVELQPCLELPFDCRPSVLTQATRLPRDAKSN